MSLWDDFIDVLVAGLKKTSLSISVPITWTGYRKPKNDMGNFKFFSDEEVAGLKDNLPAMLDMARGYAGVPFVLTSTVRTCAANQAALGAEHSAHILGLAVDIGLGHLADGNERDSARFAILKGLLEAGFKRCGIYAAHIHADIGQAPNYLQNVAWFETTS